MFVDAVVYDKIWSIPARIADRPYREIEKWRLSGR